MALKRNDFPQGESSHTLQTPTYSTYIHTYVRSTVHTTCTARTLLIICIASFFGSLMMIFSLVSRRLKRLKEPCGNYVQREVERGPKRATERERESRQLAARAEQTEWNPTHQI